MVYSKYGLTFRKIREQKRYTLSDFVQSGISKPALSKFERGESMMSFEKVYLALQTMHISLSEYENILHNFTNDEYLVLFTQIEIAMFQNNGTILLNLQHKATNFDLIFLPLCIKALYSSLSFDESEILTNFFYEIEVWGTIELYLFYFSVHTLNPKDISYILKHIFNENQVFFNSKEHTDIFTKGCCKAIYHLSQHGYKDDAETFLEQLERHHLIQSMSLRVLKNMTHGHWMSCFTKENIGKQKILEGLDIFKKVGTMEEYYYYCNRFYN